MRPGVSHLGGCVTARGPAQGPHLILRLILGASPGVCSELFREEPHSPLLSWVSVSPGFYFFLSLFFIFLGCSFSMSCFQPGYGFLLPFMSPFCSFLRTERDAEGK